MNKLVLAFTFILATLIFQGCKDSCGIEMESFNDVSDLKSLRELRDQQFKLIKSQSCSKQVRSYELKALDSLYYTSVLKILNDKILVISELKTSATDKLKKTLKLKQEYDQYLITSIANSEYQSALCLTETKMSKSLSQYKFEEVWGNRINLLHKRLKDFGSQMFSSSIGANNIEKETILVTDSTEETNLGDYVLITYDVKYEKIYNTGGWWKNRWKASGNGKWIVKCKYSDSDISIECLNPSVYKEELIDSEF
jgi:hypothetical protein